MIQRTDDARDKDVASYVVLLAQLYDEVIGTNRLSRTLG